MEPKVESMQTRKLYWMLIRKGSGTQDESQMTRNSVRVQSGTVVASVRTHLPQILENAAKNERSIFINNCGKGESEKNST